MAKAHPEIVTPAVIVNCALETDIVVTAEIAGRLDPSAVRRLGESEVKGKSAPLEVFGLR